MWRAGNTWISCRSMKEVEAEIATPLDCGFIDAVRPDDVDIPRGMEIRHICAGGLWHIHVKYVVEKPEDLLTLKNTLDEIVRALQLIEAALRGKA
jgi:hypothetical protein